MKILILSKVCNYFQSLGQSALCHTSSCCQKIVSAIKEHLQYNSLFIFHHCFHKVGRMCLYLYFLVFQYNLLICSYVKSKIKLLEQARQALFNRIYFWIWLSQLSIKCDWYLRFFWYLNNCFFFLTEFLGVIREIFKMIDHASFYVHLWEICVKLCETYGVHLSYDENMHSAVFV